MIISLIGALVVHVIAFGVLCSYIAGQKNRDQGKWFLSGALLGLFAVIAIIAVPRLVEDHRNVQHNHKEKARQ